MNSFLWYIFKSPHLYSGDQGSFMNELTFRHDQLLNLCRIEAYAVIILILGILFLFWRKK